MSSDLGRIRMQGSRRTRGLIAGSVVAAAFAAAPAGPAFAQDPAPLVCSGGALFTDPSGDAVDSTPQVVRLNGLPEPVGSLGTLPGQDNEDIVGATISSTDGVATVTIKLKDMSKTLPADATGLAWYFGYQVDGADPVWVALETDGKNYTFSSGTITDTQGNVLYNGGGAASGTVTEGPNGTISIDSRAPGAGTTSPGHGPSPTRSSAPAFRRSAASSACRARTPPPTRAATRARTPATSPSTAARPPPPRSNIRPQLGCRAVSGSAPWSARRLHLVGLAGAGMSAYALAANALGAEVSGSDRAESPYLAPVRAAGIPVAIGHAAENVPTARTPRSSTRPRSPPRTPSGSPPRARPDRPLPGRAAGRADAPARVIAVAGAHGKTTTTSMAAHVLLACGAQPGYLIGGELTHGHERRLGRRGSGWSSRPTSRTARCWPRRRRRGGDERRARPRRPVRVARRPRGRLPGVPGRGAGADRRRPGSSRWRRRGATFARRARATPGGRAFVAEGVPVTALRAGRAQRAQRGGRARGVAATGATWRLPRRRSTPSAAPGGGFSASGRPRRVRWSSTTTPTTRPRWRRRSPAPARSAPGGSSRCSSRICSRARGSSRGVRRGAGAADVACVLDVYPARERAEDFPGVRRDAGRRGRRRPRRRARGLWLPGFDDAEPVLRALLREASPLDLVLVGAGDVDALGPPAASRRRCADRPGRARRTPARARARRRRRSRTPSAIRRARATQLVGGAARPGWSAPARAWWRSRCRRGCPRRGRSPRAR